LFCLSVFIGTLPLAAIATTGYVRKNRSSF
jgi:hypothetical protein